jgi:predicted nuclease of predicted toxin-antitoxin system
MRFLVDAQLPPGLAQFLNSMDMDVSSDLLNSKASDWISLIGRSVYSKMSPVRTDTGSSFY